MIIRIETIIVVLALIFSAWQMHRADALSADVSSLRKEAELNKQALAALNNDLVIERKMASEMMAQQQKIAIKVRAIKQKKVKYDKNGSISGDDTFVRDLNRMFAENAGIPAPSPASSRVRSEF